MKINHPSAAECRTTFASIRFNEETEHLEPIIEKIVAAYEACEKQLKIEIQRTEDAFGNQDDWNPKK